MTIQEVTYLKSIDAKELIEKHIEEDPTYLALKGVNASVCNQIKYIKRARKKLPHFYDKRCIIPPVSYEQSSSWATANIKNYSGDLCIDLTCGLGVDSLHFSKSFKKVISIEADEMIYEVALHNFNLLDALNIEVKNTRAEEFIVSYKGDKADLIYVDPARRNEKQRTFLFEDCSPNIIELICSLKNITKRLVIKASPLFDIDEALNIFSQYGGLNISVVSLIGECKELLIDVSFEDIRHTSITLNIINRDVTTSYTFDYEVANYCYIKYNDLNSQTYLYIPDVVFYKSRRLDKAFDSHSFKLTSAVGVALSNENIENFDGRKFKIEQWFDYKPKQLKSYFKSQNIKSATIYKKDFALSTENIYKTLSLKSGSDVNLLFTTVDGKAVIFLISF